MPALFDARGEAQGYADRYKEAILGSEDEIIAERLESYPSAPGGYDGYGTEHRICPSVLWEAEGKKRPV